MKVISRVPGGNSGHFLYSAGDLDAHLHYQAIENFNPQLRKVTKTKSAFVSDDALIKIPYLATTNIAEKWTLPIRNGGTILDHLMIYFGDRVDVTI